MLLCFQIGEQFTALGSAINLRLCVVTGGMDMVTQAKELCAKPHVVVATPGRSVHLLILNLGWSRSVLTFSIIFRLADHLESCNTFNLKNLQFLVIDEADRLLSGRFNDQLRTIFSALPKQKQILLFSATMTDSIEQVKSITSKEVRNWI